MKSWTTVSVLVAMLFSMPIRDFIQKPAGTLREASKYLFVHRLARILAASVAR